MDAALVEVLPKVEAATDDAAYRTAVQMMLDRLGDPRTRVARKIPQPQEAQPNRAGKDPTDRPLFSWVEESVLVLNMDVSSPGAKLSDPKTWETVLAAFTKANSVIFDLRGEENFSVNWYVLSRLYPLLPPREIRGPAERYLVHSGYRPQTAITSGAYISAFQTALPQVFRAAPDGKGKRAVFLIDSQTDLPPIALALHDSGEAFLVSQGELSPALGGIRRTIPLTEGFEVQVRTSELIGPNGLIQVQLDAEIPGDAKRGLKGAAVLKALDLLRDPPKSKKVPNTAPGAGSTSGTWRPDKQYEKMVYPDRQYRLLALFRFWLVIDLFYPYKHLLDQDWDSVLLRFLSVFASARDAREYALAVAEMAACTQDTHTGVSGSKELQRFFGEAAPPVALRLIENKPTITDLLDAEAVKDLGVAVGDVVVAVDGEPVEKRMARIGKYTAGSNPGSHARYVLRRLLNGPEGTTLTLSIRDRNDKIRDVALPRKSQYLALWATVRDGDIYKILDGNIGYCDLERLELRDVDSMLERLKDTRAIIFDLRGYPQGTVWALAARLNVKGAKYGAAYQRRLLTGAPGTDGIEELDSKVTFFQAIPPSDKWKYKGKTVTLIDERAISQSEYTAQYLEAACGTTFIGSPTAGADGDITTLSLPGGLVVRFSGQEVRHANGKEVQRIGIKPEIEVRPTLAGLRAGRDEILIRALKYINEGN